MRESWWKRLRSVGCQRRFAVEQGLFALNAPAVTTEATISPDNSVARDDHRQFVGSAGTGHCAHGLRPAKRVRKLRITDRLPRWDGL